MGAESTCSQRSSSGRQRETVSTHDCWRIENAQGTRASQPLRETRGRRPAGPQGAVAARRELAPAEGKLRNLVVVMCRPVQGRKLGPAPLPASSDVPASIQPADAGCVTAALCPRPTGRPRDPAGDVKRARRACPLPPPPSTPSGLAPKKKVPSALLGRASRAYGAHQKTAHIPSRPLPLRDNGYFLSANYNSPARRQTCMKEHSRWVQTLWSPVPRPA